MAILPKTVNRTHVQHPQYYITYNVIMDNERFELRRKTDGHNSSVCIPYTVRVTYVITFFFLFNNNNNNSCRSRTVIDNSNSVGNDDDECSNEYIIYNGFGGQSSVIRLRRRTRRVQNIYVRHVLIPPVVYLGR